jgi:ribonuclease HI
MELLAAIQGLRSLARPSQVQLFTVSQYLHQGITQWVAGWEARGWKTREGQPVRHKELWLKLQETVDRHEIEWHILRAGDRPPESEQAAVLAGQAARTAQAVIQNDTEERD